MIGKSYIFHLFLFLLILPDSIYSQDNICLIPQVESMVRKKGTLSIERLESIHFPDEWKNTGNLLGHVVRTQEDQFALQCRG